MTNNTRNTYEKRPSKAVFTALFCVIATVLLFVLIWTVVEQNTTNAEMERIQSVLNDTNRELERLRQQIDSNDDSITPMQAREAGFEEEGTIIFHVN